eukprot:gb/GEZN01006525.1/.p1 GENE.gb/GEZN01006525.1/~~gb/GEZN01006525.1/.p1  ORF type:complete len:470 (-),score=45.18 gb/GEZN01006525.1/:209-1618(-)
MAGELSHDPMLGNSKTEALCSTSYLRIVAPPHAGGMSALNSHKLMAYTPAADEDDCDVTFHPADTEEIPEGDEILEVNLLTADQQRLRVITLGIGFLCVYTAFGSAKNYITKLFPVFGYYSMGLLYFLFSIFSLGAPALTGRLGARKCIFGGVCCYVLFILAAMLHNKWMLLAICIVSGMAASLLWNGQALYLTKTCLGPDLAKNTGLFFTLHNGNGVLGNLVLSLLLANHFSLNKSFFVLFCIGVFGVIVLAFLPSSHCRSPVALPSPLRQSSDTFAMFSQAQMQALVPMLFFMGTVPPLISGALPPLLSDEVVAYCFLVNACCTMVASLAAGHLLSTCGWPLVNTFFTLSALGGVYIAGMALSSSDPDTADLWFYAAYGLFGTAEAIAICLMMNAVGLSFTKNRGPAFGCYRFTVALAQAMGFLYSHYINHYVFLAIVGALAIISATSFGFTASRIDWRMLSSEIGH